jgi:HlyD family secretion protein
MDELENNHKHRRWLWIALVLVAAVLVAVFLLRRGKGDGVERYRAEPAANGDITMTVSATGTVSAVTTVQVGSQVSGIIARLHADFNDQVKKGQLLAELDPTPFEQTVEQRRADVVKSQVTLTNAQITFDRQKRLLAAGLIAQSDLDSAKATYDGAKAQLDQSRAALHQAETNLAYAKIFSPIDGVVVARQYDAGQTVAASFQAPTLFTIAQDLTKMQVQADVDQSDIGRVAVGEVSRFTVDAYPEQEFRGKISQVRLNATINQNVITYPVIIDVPNPDGKLRPSMTANVTIEVATVKDVLRIPNAALRFKPEAKPGEAAGAAGGRRAAAGGSGPAGGGAAGGAGGGTPGGGSAGGGGAADSGGTAAGGGRRQGFERAAAERPEGGMAGLGRGFPGGGRGKGAQAQTVYVLGENNALRRVFVRTGISDGHYTQVVGGGLKLGDKVVTGLATAKVEVTGRLPGTTGGGGGRPPGMGGRF